MQGPILEWWLSGFDRGERVLIGITTELCNYYLQEASPEYSAFIRPIFEAVHITKLTVEFLEQNDGASYEEMLLFIQQAPSIPECGQLGDDQLLQHAHFLSSTKQNILIRLKIQLKQNSSLVKHWNSLLLSVV